LIQMAIKLLPAFQHIIIKCGEFGVVVVMQLPGEVAARSGWLADPVAVDRCVVSTNDHLAMIVVQHFPAIHVPDVVNVTGAGDTFVGALLANLVKDPKLFQQPDRLAKCISLAQLATTLTLRSSHSVSPELSNIERQ